MTDNEKIRDILNRHYGHEVMAGSDLWFTKQYQDRFAHLLEMAEWKEQEMIKKACEWLESKSCFGYIEDVKADEFIEDFKKAMKGE